MNDPEQQMENMLIQAGWIKNIHTDGRTYYSAPKGVMVCRLKAPGLPLQDAVELNRYIGVRKARNDNER